MQNETIELSVERMSARKLPLFDSNSQLAEDLGICRLEQNCRSVSFVDIPSLDVSSRNSFSKLSDIDRTGTPPLRILEKAKSEVTRSSHTAVEITGDTEVKGNTEVSDDTEGTCNSSNIPELVIEENKKVRVSNASSIVLNRGMSKSAFGVSRANLFDSRTTISNASEHMGLSECTTTPRKGSFGNGSKAKNMAVTSQLSKAVFGASRANIFDARTTIPAAADLMKPSGKREEKEAEKENSNTNMESTAITALLENHEELGDTLHSVEAIEQDQGEEIQYDFLSMDKLDETLNGDAEETTENYMEFEGISEQGSVDSFISATSVLSHTGSAGRLRFDRVNTWISWSSTDNLQKEADTTSLSMTCEIASTNLHSDISQSKSSLPAIEGEIQPRAEKISKKVSSEKEAQIRAPDASKKIATASPRTRKIGNKN